MDRLRHLTLCFAIAFCALACDEKADRPAAGGRFESVRADSKPVSTAAKQFCDVVLPAGAKKFVAPPEKPIPGYTPSASKPNAWKWVNLWATWCEPCMGELPLLGRWNDALAKDGLPVDFELFSVDEEEAALKKRLEKPMPGRVHWLRGETDLGPTLQSLGVDASSAIPVHALVDPAGNLRCVRVGSVSEQDYAAIRNIVSGH